MSSSRLLLSCGENFLGATMVAKAKVSVTVRVPGKGRSRRFTTSALVLGLFFTLGALFIFLLGIVVSDYSRVGLAHLEGGSSLKNLYGSWIQTLHEKRKLENRSRSLEEEVTALRDRLLAAQRKGEKNSHYEARLREKVEKLEAVVKSAVALGLVAKLPTKARQGTLVEAGRGVGGAEIDCERHMDECRALAESDFTSDKRERSEQLLDRIDYYAELLRALPVGAPALGGLSSGFGLRVSPFGEGIRYHQGLDVAAPHGRPVVATGDGVVVAARYDRTYGNVVDVQHSPAVLTRYAHLSRTLVRQGARVRRGQVLGAVGSTGRSTGSHLHYEVRIWGKPRNPVKFITIANDLSDLLRAG